VVPVGDRQEQELCSIERSRDRLRIRARQEVKLQFLRLTIR
jgi:hypothetical protein